MLVFYLQSAPAIIQVLDLLQGRPIIEISKLDLPPFCLLGLSNLLCDVVHDIVRAFEGRAKKKFVVLSLLFSHFCLYSSKKCSVKGTSALSFTDFYEAEIKIERNLMAVCNKIVNRFAKYQ